jgi:hypothetical protein
MPLYDFVNSNYFGYYFGCSLYADKKFSVTAEADFANETAFTIASELRF